MSSSFDAAFSCPPISPLREMGAYEALWSEQNTTFKTIADVFRKNPGVVPSDLVTPGKIDSVLSHVLQRIKQSNIDEYGVRVNGSIDYPESLRDAAHPIELLYYRGNWDLVESPKRVAIVGSRNPSEEGIRRARKIAHLLVQDGYTIISGLAKGIDTAAHTAAIESGGRTIAVIGTPITEYYPPENRSLQELIAKEHLLISQVPIWRYLQQNFKWNKLFFPERNATMSALSQATIIVEASNTSGTLTQARAALHQGRKLFILDNCFQNPELTWPSRFESQGAVRVRDINDIKAALE
jgi:DNA processing protein